MSSITRSKLLKLLRRRHDKKTRILTTTTSRQLLSFHTSRDDDFSDIDTILRGVQNRNISIDDAKKKVQQQMMEGKRERQPLYQGNPTEGFLNTFANLDHKRADRTGFPEAVFASGKTPEQIATILDDMALNVNNIIAKQARDPESRSFIAQRAILATRVDKQLYEKLSEIPLQNGIIKYHEVAKIVSMKAFAVSEIEEEQKIGKIIVSCAGTTDMPVAEEAAITLEEAGCRVERIYDVGVAGLHRIINALPKLCHPEVDCVIVCAGMDGALPSVVAGLVGVPVVAVPTSIGYGASFNGISAMLTMLNSCSPGVGVVNIDNGFGGAALAFKCVKRQNL